VAKSGLSSHRLIMKSNYRPIARELVPSSFIMCQKKPTGRGRCKLSRRVFEFASSCFGFFPGKKKCVRRQVFLLLSALLFHRRVFHISEGHSQAQSTLQAAISGLNRSHHLKQREQQ